MPWRNVTWVPMNGSNRILMSGALRRGPNFWVKRRNSFEFGCLGLVFPCFIGFRDLTPIVCAIRRRSAQQQRLAECAQSNPSGFCTKTTCFVVSIAFVAFRSVNGVGCHPGDYEPARLLTCIAQRAGVCIGGWDVWWSFWLVGFVSGCCGC